jgi:hypothetical protein
VENCFFPEEVVGGGWIRRVVMKEVGVSEAVGVVLVALLLSEASSKEAVVAENLSPRLSIVLAARRALAVLGLRI